MIDLMTQAEALQLSGAELDRAAEMLGETWGREKQQIEAQRDAETRQQQQETQKPARIATSPKQRHPQTNPKRRNSQTVLANAAALKKRTVKGKRRSQFESLTDYELRMARLEAFYTQTLEIEIGHGAEPRDQSQSAWSVKMSLLQKAGEREAANPFSKANYKAGAPRSVVATQSARANCVLVCLQRSKRIRRCGIKPSARGGAKKANRGRGPSWPF